jgi:glycosyltransferase involved in cell wall biosynthesis
MSSNAMFSFHHIGGVSEGELHPSIQSFGWLESSERNRQTELLNSDVALLISQCPETYCLVLSDLIRLRIPIIASKIGAITERLFDRENTVLVENFEDAFSWVKALEEFGQNGYFDLDYDNLFQQEAKQIIKTKRNRNKSLFN